MTNCPNRPLPPVTTIFFIATFSVQTCFVNASHDRDPLLHPPPRAGGGKRLGQELSTAKSNFDSIIFSESRYPSTSLSATGSVHIGLQKSWLWSVRLWARPPNRPSLLPLPARDRAMS